MLTPQAFLKASILEKNSTITYIKIGDAPR